MTDQAMMTGLEDIVTGNVHPAVTTNDTAAGTNPAANMTTLTDATGVSVAGTNPTANTTTSLQALTMMIASLQNTIANLER